jgi:pimeloyl-ACP methyl ester carboxylesterase
LVLVGDEDHITPPSLSRALVDLVGTAARFETIVGAGHLANLEQPAAFNSAVDSFISGTGAN